LFLLLAELPFGVESQKALLFPCSKIEFVKLSPVSKLCYPSCLFLEGSKIFPLYFWCEQPWNSTSFAGKSDSSAKFKTLFHLICLFFPFFFPRNLGREIYIIYFQLVAQTSL
jgi:hypothetical protein